MAMMRMSENRLGEAQSQSLRRARAAYRGHAWRRPAWRLPEASCNALENAASALARDRSTWSNWSETSTQAKADASDAFYESLRCSWTFVGAPFPSEATGRPLDYALHATAVERLLADAAKSDAPRCLRTVLLVIELAFDLIPGGREQQVGFANTEITKGAQVALGCVQRAPLETLAELTHPFLSVASQPPPIAWTVEYHFLRDAEYEETLFQGRPLVPRFWDGARYELTDGGRILSRMRKALDAARRARELGELGPTADGKLTALVSDVPAYLGASVRRAHTVGDSLRSFIRVRAVACGIWWLTKADGSAIPAVCSAQNAGGPLIFSPTAESLKVYASGPNGRDDGGSGDDEGITVTIPGSYRR